MTRLSEVDALVSNGGDAAAIDSTLVLFSQQARKGVSRLVASYQQDDDPSSITAITTFITSARQAIGDLAPRLPPESVKDAVMAVATIEELRQQSAMACPGCEKPRLPIKATTPTPIPNSLLSPSAIGPVPTSAASRPTTG